MLHDWYAIAVSYAQARGVTIAGVLRAFGDEGAAEPASTRAHDNAHAYDEAFERLDQLATREAAGLAATIVSALAQVDRGQAELFARRFDSVLALLTQLAGLGSLEARVFRVALVGRASEILADPRPRALRVRALCDYYYSQAALLHHRARSSAHHGADELEVLARQTSWRALEPGLAHAKLEGLTKRGPIHVNLLRLRGGRIQSVDCRGHDFAEFVTHSGARAGVSGGFFLYSEPDIQAPSLRGDPVGMLLDGELRPPALRRATLMQRGGRYEIERVGLDDVLLSYGDIDLQVAAVNDPSYLGRGLVAFNRAWGRRLVWPHALSVVGNRIVERSLNGHIDIPLAGFVLAFASSPDPALRAGEALRVHLPGPSLHAAMAGGPMLLGEGALDLGREDFAGSAPPLTFSADETFDQNLLPRMGVGLGPQGELIFCAVDGRNFDRAPGMTLGMTGRILRALGCERAMNLDGGSSKRMVVNGEVVDLPSTEVVAGEGEVQRVRPVRSGILLFGA